MLGEVGLGRRCVKDASAYGAPRRLGLAEAVCPGQAHGAVRPNATPLRRDRSVPGAPGVLVGPCSGTAGRAASGGDRSPEASDGASGGSAVAPGPAREPHPGRRHSHHRGDTPHRAEAVDAEGIQAGTDAWAQLFEALRDAMSRGVDPTADEVLMTPSSTMSATFRAAMGVLPSRMALRRAKCSTAPMNPLSAATA